MDKNHCPIPLAVKGPVEAALSSAQARSHNNPKLAISAQNCFALTMMPQLNVIS